MSSVEIAACDDCLRRIWLLRRLSGHLDVRRARIESVLCLSDEDIIAQLSGRHRAEIEADYGRYNSAAVAEQQSEATRAGLNLLCRCQPRYPERLRELPAPPAVLHITGELDRFLETCRRDPVGIVGSRSAGEYGRATAELIARGVGTAGLSVVSGMATGIDGAAHRGALGAGAATIAVLPGPAHEATPAGNRALHEQLVRHGTVVSEVGPGTRVRNWSYLARNRIIAALSSVSIVVQAGSGSGSLVTIDQALRLGRRVGAVPGRVDDPLSNATNGLIADGRAVLVTGARDVLDLVAQARGTSRWQLDVALVTPARKLTPQQQSLLAAISRDGSLNSIFAAVVPADQALAELADLELSGAVKRGPGGRYLLIDPYQG